MVEEASKNGIDQCYYRNVHTNSSAVLSFQVKHDTSKPFLPDPVLGTVEVEVDKLLERCQNQQRKSGPSALYYMLTNVL